MEDIYTYYDYQKYLNDFYKEKKSKDTFFSFRYISQRVGIDHSLLVKIFLGKRHIGPKSVPLFANLLGLTARKAEYFGLLVLYGKAKTNQENKHYFEKLLAFSEIGSRKVDADKYEFYQKWYYSAIREVIRICDFTDDYVVLSKAIEPTITPLEAKKAIALLTRLGFIKKNAKGVYEQTSQFISTGSEWKSIAIRSFQKESLQLAIRALDEIPKEKRDISTVTMTLDADGLEKVKQRVMAFQQELIGISSTCSKVNAVYQVNLQVFPMSGIIEEPSKDGSL